MASQKQIEFELVLNKKFSALEKKLNDLLNDKSKGIYHALEELDKYVKKNAKKKTTLCKNALNIAPIIDVIIKKNIFE